MDRVYARHGYERHIDYSEEPPRPFFSKENQEWIEEQLNTYRTNDNEDAFIETITSAAPKRKTYNNPTEWGTLILK